MKSMVAMLLTTAAMSAVMGCGKKEEAQSPYNQTYPQPTATTPNGMPPGVDPAPTTTAPTTDPNGTNTAAASGVTGTAQVIDPSVAAVATGALGGLAATNAPGMVAEGSVIAGNFQTGNNLEQTFTLQPGKCYTVIASGIGVSEITVTASFVSPVPGIPTQFGTVTGKSSAMGAQAILGPKDKCLRLALVPLAMPAKVTVTATKGAGLIAAQLYSK